MSSAQEQWIESHPFLRKVAEFQQAVIEVFAKLESSTVPSPDWNHVLDAYRQGVPLLQNAPADYESAAGSVLASGVSELQKYDLAEPVKYSLKALQEYFEAKADNATKAIEWVVKGEPENAPVQQEGLLRVLAWAAIRRTLGPAMKSFAERRNDDQWMRGYCPVCGALPPLAHVLPEGGQPRTLTCCCCHSSWQFRRIGCPFCDNDDQDQLSIFTIDEEPLYRLDTCRACNGYLKTFTGKDNLELHLSDWSTLHLDVLARQNNLERKGASLFDV